MSEQWPKPEWQQDCEFDGSYEYDPTLVGTEIYRRLDGLMKVAYGLAHDGVKSTVGHPANGVEVVRLIPDYNHQVPPFSIIISRGAIPMGADTTSHQLAADEIGLKISTPEIKQPRIKFSTYEDNPDHTGQQLRNIFLQQKDFLLVASPENGLTLHPDSCQKSFVESNISLWNDREEFEELSSRFLYYPDSFTVKLIIDELPSIEEIKATLENRITSEMARSVTDRIANDADILWMEKYQFISNYAVANERFRAVETTQTSDADQTPESIDDITDKITLRYGGIKGTLTRTQLTDSPEYRLELESDLLRSLFVEHKGRFTDTEFVFEIDRFGALLASEEMKPLKVTQETAGFINAFLENAEQLSRQQQEE